MVLHANAIFLDALGYELNEIVGKHHRIFVDPAEADSDDYRAFWQSLARGRIADTRVLPTPEGRSRGLDPGVLPAGPRRSRFGDGGR